MAKLEDFIAQYLKNQKAEDYESWLSRYGEDSGAAYRDAIAEADSQYAESLATHGKKNAALLSKGMVGSGYSDYLDGVAYAERARSREAAERQKQETDARNRKDYAAFLKDATEYGEKKVKEEAARTDELISGLLSQKPLDFVSAKNYLVFRGMDDDSADALANTCVYLTRNSDTRAQRVLQHALSNYFGYYAAYDYAIANGLSESVAKKIAGAAYVSQKSYFGEYANYYEERKE